MLIAKAAFSTQIQSYYFFFSELSLFKQILQKIECHTQQAGVD